MISERPPVLIKCVYKTVTIQSTVIALGRGLAASSLVVLMSGHFGLQPLCHLTSQLFCKKGQSTATKKHGPRVHCSHRQTHIFLGVHTHTAETVYMMKHGILHNCMSHRFLPECTANKASHTHIRPY